MVTTRAVDWFWRHYLNALFQRCADQDFPGHLWQVNVTLLFPPIAALWLVVVSCFEID
jgi:hypothetical protein